MTNKDLLKHLSMIDDKYILAAEDSTIVVVNKENSNQFKKKTKRIKIAFNWLFRQSRSF